jgi:SAM-dependent methyltransferase
VVTRDEVIAAFRLLLGREPESDAVVDKLLSVSDWKNLREVFMSSGEFRNKMTSHDYMGRLKEYMEAPPNSVDVKISDAQFSQLLEHVHSSWETLGKQQPHFSVLTNPIFLPEHIEANVGSFYESGEENVQTMEKAALRGGKTLSADWTCFELGCGVGRVTTRLATRFPQIVACDISRPHLDLAATHLADRNVRNVSFVQLTSLATLEALDPFDFFYSVIVLQHNPPPVIFRILQAILRKVRVGGGVYFQVPIASLGYRFSVADYLATINERRGTMEMHVLPQVHLFGLLEDSGFRILDLQRDNSPGPDFYSLTIFAERKD